MVLQGLATTTMNPQRGLRPMQQLQRNTLEGLLQGKIITITR
jgi:hypothetical protein